MIQISKYRIDIRYWNNLAAIAKREIGEDDKLLATDSRGSGIFWNFLWRELR